MKDVDWFCTAVAVFYFGLYSYDCLACETLQEINICTPYMAKDHCCQGMLPIIDMRTWYYKLRLWSYFLEQKRENFAQKLGANVKKYIFSCFTQDSNLFCAHYIHTVVAKLNIIAFQLSQICKQTAVLKMIYL